MLTNSTTQLMQQGIDMRAFGSKRTYHDCRVYRAGNGKKILFTVDVKSKKSGRKFIIELTDLLW
jgi:hypothetical protein